MRNIREIDGEQLVKQATLQLLIAGEIIDQLYTDGLELGEGYRYNDFVRARWQQRGLLAD